MSFETAAPTFNAADPNAVFLNASCLDLLLIEIVPLAYRMVEHSTASHEVPRGAADDDDQREAALRRLDAIGYRVGQGLTERYENRGPKQGGRALNLQLKGRSAGFQEIGLDSLTA